MAFTTEPTIYKKPKKVNFLFSKVFARSECRKWSISQRYERQGAIVLRSNKAFSAWGEVFAGDAVMASAALDRSLHRCTVVNIRGESYRLKEKRSVAKETGAVQELAAAIAANS